MFAADVNPHIDPFLYRQSNNRAKEIVAKGRGEFITLADGRSAVQLKPQAEEQGNKSIGRGNLVPFGRAYNPMIHPPSLNYEIPYAGDCRSVCLTRFRLRRREIDRKHVLMSRVRKVSARKIDFTAAQYLNLTRLHRGVAMPCSNVSSPSLDTTAQTA